MFEIILLVLAGLTVIFGFGSVFIDHKIADSFYSLAHIFGIAWLLLILVYAQMSGDVTVFGVPL